MREGHILCGIAQTEKVCGYCNFDQSLLICAPQGVAKNAHGVVNGFRDNANVRLHEQDVDRFAGCYPDDR